MPRAASNQQGPPHGDHPATPTPRSSYGNPTSRSYQPATHYTYPPINQLNHPNSAVSVSATHLSESIVHRLSPGLNAAFSMLHQNTLTQINNVQNSIQSLSKNLSDARAEAKKEYYADRVDKLDKTIGENDGISLIRRISSIEFAIAELVERMRDPDAAVVPIIRRDAAISPRPEILPSKRYRDISVGRTPPQSPSLPPVWSPTDEHIEAQEGEGNLLANANEALRSRIRASVDALKSSIGDDLFADIPEPPIHNETDTVDPQDVAVGTASRFSTAPFTADRLAKPAEWSTKGVHPSSLASTSVQASLSDLQCTSLSKPSQQPTFSPSPVPIRPARDIPEGTVASLRQSALGDHLFVRPLEDTGLPKLNPQTTPLNVSYPLSDAINASAATTLLSPPATTSPEGISFEFPDAMDEADVRELALTPGTSFASSEQEENPELAMKQELEFISRKLASSPAHRREETLSPLSALEDDEQQSVSTHKPVAAVVNTPSSSTRREESLRLIPSDDEQPISKLRHESLSPMSSEDEQPLSKSQALTANITPSSAPREKSLSSISSGGNQPLSKPPVLATNTLPQSKRRSEFVRRVSSEAGQPLSKSRDLAASVPSSSVRREESLSAISSERNRPLSKSPVLAASIPAPIDVPAREPRRSKRKRNVNSLVSQNQQQAKKMKTETENTYVPPAKETSIRPRNSKSQTVQHSHRKPKSHSRSASKSVAPVLCEWPAKTEAWQNTIWYHYGCVGIVSSDLRLEDDEQFTCPTCHYSPATRITMRGREDECARPDCSFPGHAEAEGEFVVERIVGRKPTSGSGTNFLWLIKWHGYPITMAEWCPEENMGDCAKLVLKFNEDVVTEGLEVDTDQPILLEEAVNGGWDE